MVGSQEPTILCYANSLVNSVCLLSFGSVAVSVGNHSMEKVTN